MAAPSFLTALSNFWHRFFRDSADVRALMEGEAHLVGQAYLNLLSDVLNYGVKDTPLFVREYFKLIPVREDQLVYRDTGTAANDRWVLRSDDSFQAIPLLQEKIFQPLAGLESGMDFDVANEELRFITNPCTSVPTGFSVRSVQVLSGGSFSDPSVADWDVAGVRNGDTLIVSSNHDVARELEITGYNFTGRIAGDKVLFDGNTYTIDAVYSSSRVKFTTPHVIDTAKSVTLQVTNSTGLTTYFNGTATVALPANVERLTINLVRGNTLYISADTPVPAGLLFYHWRIYRLRTTGAAVTGLPASTANDGAFGAAGAVAVPEVAFWAVDALLDQYNLYETYGYLFTEKRASTEAYRAFLRGLTQLYVNGPVFARMESGLNAVAGLPLIASEGEVLLSANNGIDVSDVNASLNNYVLTVPGPTFSSSALGGKIWLPSPVNAANRGVFTIVEVITPTQVRLETDQLLVNEAGLDWHYSGVGVGYVSTDRAIYNFPFYVEARADILDPLNWGTLTFKAFEVLTTAVQVEDYLSDPEWWFGKVIPQELLPGQSLSRRTVSLAVFPNTYDDTANGEAYYGDPGLYYGLDEEGTAAAEPHHHNAAYWYMDRFLKYHMFLVRLDSDLDLTQDILDSLQALIEEVKPAHTYAFIERP